MKSNKFRKEWRSTGPTQSSSWYIFSCAIWSTRGLFTFFDQLTVNSNLCTDCAHRVLIRPKYRQVQADTHDWSFLSLNASNCVPIDGWLWVWATRYCSTRVSACTVFFIASAGRLCHLATVYSFKESSRCSANMPQSTVESTTRFVLPLQ